MRQILLFIVTLLLIGSCSNPGMYTGEPIYLKPITEPEFIIINKQPGIEIMVDRKTKVQYMYHVNYGPFNSVYYGDPQVIVDDNLKPVLYKEFSFLDENKKLSQEWSRMLNMAMKSGEEDNNNEGVNLIRFPVVGR